MHIKSRILSKHKKSEIMTFARKWRELEIIMLSTTSQTQKDKHQVFFSLSQVYLCAIISKNMEKLEISHADGIR